MDSRETDIIDAFARVLQARRREMGHSQEELAHRAGLSTSYVSLLESRKRQPTLTVMVRLARELDMPFSEFIVAIENKISG